MVTSSNYRTRVTKLKLILEKQNISATAGINANVPIAKRIAQRNDACWYAKVSSATDKACLKMEEMNGTIHFGKRERACFGDARQVYQ